MLNCTAPDCILHIHHNHFTIQHHLQDNRQHHEHQQHTVMSGDSSHVPESALGNDTSSNGEIVHLDAPYDGWIMVCGFLIAMVLVAFIIILVAFTISKLRKREDSNLSPESGAPTTNHNNNIIQPDVVVSASTTPVEPPPFLWLYSSKNNLAPPTSTTTSSQYTLYNNDQEVLVHSASCEDTRKACNGSSGGGGGGNGLKKNLGGKWKKLVKKKSPQEAYTIPAELKDQLKQIYVY